MAKPKSTANRRKKTYTSSMEYSTFAKLEEYSKISMINMNRIIEKAVLEYLAKMNEEE